jgi:hypothetical protein
LNISSTVFVSLVDKKPQKKKIMKSLFTLLAVFILVTAATPPAGTVLGTKKLNLTETSVVISAAPNKGGFATLVIELTGANVTVNTLVLNYADGTKEEIMIKSNFTPEATIAKFAMSGKNSKITDVLVNYASDATGNAKIVLTGKIK